ncbi:hypothetical protein Tco_1234531 [Tanacetum coccineum]
MMMGVDVYVTLTEDVYVYVTLTLSNDESFPILNTSRNSSSGSPEVVKDDMDSGFMDPMVMEGVDEQESTIPKSFASLVTNEALTCKVHMDYARALIDIRARRELKEDMGIAIPNMEDDGEVLHTMRVEYEWETPRCGVGIVFGFNNSFDVLNTIEEGDKLESNRRSSNSGKKVFQDVAGTSSGSPSNTHLVARINEQESQMIKVKLVLLDDDGKPLKPSTSTLPSSSNVVSIKVDDLVNEDNDSEVKDVYDETAIYMASTASMLIKLPKVAVVGEIKACINNGKKITVKTHTMMMTLMILV